jgi:hypothetical protein
LHGCSDHIPEFCRLRQKCHTASDRCVLEEFSLFCDVKIPLWVILLLWCDSHNRKKLRDSIGKRRKFKNFIFAFHWGCSFLMRKDHGVMSESHLKCEYRFISLMPRVLSGA